MLERIFRKIVLKYISRLRGKKEAQPLFEWLYDQSLTGMNYGGGAFADESGEEQAILYIKKRLEKEKSILTLFDVGANLGQYAGELLKCMNDVKKQIHCFEPSLDTFKQLSKNISNHKEIKLNNFGIGETNSMLKLYSDKTTSGLASVFKRKLDHFSIEMNMEEEIEIKTIDTYCSENKISHIHLLKIDIEGNELNVLKGASTMLNKDAIDFIQFEFGGSNIDSRTYFQDFYYLLSQKFNIYRILMDGVYPVSQYHENKEIFITTNYLAQRKTIS